MSAEDPIVVAALARGFLSAEQLAEATQAERSLAAEGRSPGLRALLAQRYLRAPGDPGRLLEVAAVGAPRRLPSPRAG